MIDIAEDTLLPDVIIFLAAESGPSWPAPQETDGVLLLAGSQLKPACVCLSV